MDTQVVLDYYHTTLYPSEYEKTVKNGGYIKMPYLHSKGDSQPNLVYGVRKYKTDGLFIVKSSSPEYDGELVIKHVPITNGDASVYLVVPLKTRPTVYEETAIDKIIHRTNTSAFEFHLGEIIGYNTTCKVNADNTVFVLAPVLIKSTFDDFLPLKQKEWSVDDKFRNIELVFHGRQTNGHTRRSGGDGVEGFASSRRSVNTSDEQPPMYERYDCEPIFENDGKNKQSIEVMPVTSELAKNVGKMNVMNATVHFALFVIMGIIAAIVTPISYKTLFVDYIKQFGIENTAQAASLKMFSYIGTAVLLFFTLGISINGITVGDSLQTSIGMIMSIFVIISVCVMTYFKQVDPTTYSLGDVNVDFFKDSKFGEYFWARLNHNNNSGSKGAGGLWIVFIAISIIMYFFGKFDKNKKKDKAKRNFILYNGVVFGLLLSLYLATRIMP